MTILRRPATGQIVSDVPDIPPDGVAVAVTRARAAFAEWGRTTPAVRFRKDMSQEAVQEYSVTRHLMIKHTPPAPKESFRPA
jgi:acyl-CoA reductase-like NAD-dependent aldehyde dehydrogenase